MAIAGYGTIFKFYCEEMLGILKFFFVLNCTFLTKFTEAIRRHSFSAEAINSYNKARKKLKLTSGPGKATSVCTHAHFFSCVCTYYQEVCKIYQHRKTDFRLTQKFWCSFC